MKHAYLLAAPIALACSPAMAATQIASTNGSIAPGQTLEFNQLFTDLNLNPGAYEFAIGFNSDNGVVERVIQGQRGTYFQYDEMGNLFHSFIDYYDDFPRLEPTYRNTFAFRFQDGEVFRSPSMTYSYTADYFYAQISNISEDFPIFYSIRLTSVPEPSTWALLILGFGMVGVAMRARRQVSVSYA